MRDVVDLRGGLRAWGQQSGDTAGAQAWRAGWGSGRIETTLRPSLLVYRTDVENGTVGGVPRRLELTVKGSNPGRLEVVSGRVFKAPVQPDGSFQLDVSDGDRNGHWKERIVGRLTSEGIEIRRYDRVDFVERNGRPMEISEMYIASSRGPGILTRR